jgi:hypothetical protein
LPFSVNKGTDGKKDLWDIDIIKKEKFIRQEEKKQTKFDLGCKSCLASESFHKIID